MMRRLSFREFGFSLVEMMVVVAIISIGAAMAMPNMPRFGVDQRLNAVVYDFTLRIRELRSQAVSGERGVTRKPGNIELSFPKTSLVLKGGVFFPSSRWGVIDAQIIDQNEISFGVPAENIQFKDLYGENYYVDLGRGQNRLDITFGGDGLVQWSCTPSCAGNQYISLALRSSQSTNCHVVQISGTGLISTYLSNRGPCVP